VSFTVRGLPGPQGSKAFKGFNARGRAILVESSKKVKPWRKAVSEAAAEVPLAEILDGPLLAEVVFSMPRPKRHFGTGRNAGVLKPSAPMLHDRMPDLSKLLRSTEDALKDIIWADDARVSAYGRLVKFYCGAADPDALDEPGAVIRVRPFAECSREQPAHVPGELRSDVPLFVLGEAGLCPGSKSTTARTTTRNCSTRPTPP
jgi:crossover junction endodeoxyribonuclease RusA